MVIFNVSALLYIFIVFKYWQARILFGMVSISALPISRYCKLGKLKKPHGHVLIGLFSEEKYTILCKLQKDSGNSYLDCQFY